MSYTHVSGCTNVGARTEYLLFGIGARKARHLERGTSRLPLLADGSPAITCDTGSVEDFVALAQGLADEHGRKIQAYSYIQSFPLDDARPGSPRDVTQVHALGVELARSMGENTPILVVTHADGEGHDGCGAKVHNHILRLNHNAETDGCVQKYRNHYPLAKLNDEIMREAGMSVIEPDVSSYQHVSQLDHFQELREELSSRGKTFDVELISRCLESLDDESVTDWNGYVRALESRGVLVQEKLERNKRKDGETVESPGITYVMMDETGPKYRLRRRKASSLPVDLTHSGVSRTLAEREQDRRWLQQIEQQAQERAVLAAKEASDKAFQEWLARQTDLSQYAFSVDRVRENYDALGPELAQADLARQIAAARQRSRS